MTATKPQLLLTHYLKQLKLPSFLREYDKMAIVCQQWPDPLERVQPLC